MRGQVQGNRRDGRGRRLEAVRGVVRVREVSRKSRGAIGHAGGDVEAEPTIGNEVTA